MQGFPGNTTKKNLVGWWGASAPSHGAGSFSFFGFPEIGLAKTQRQNRAANLKKTNVVAHGCPNSTAVPQGRDLHLQLQPCGAREKFLGSTGELRMECCSSCLACSSVCPVSSVPVFCPVFQFLSWMKAYDWLINHLTGAKRISSAEVLRRCGKTFHGGGLLTPDLRITS